MADRTPGDHPSKGTLDRQPERIFSVVRVLEIEPVADSDQATSARDIRRRATRARLEAADNRDAIADRRDLAALAREQAAAARRLATAQIAAVSEVAADAHTLTRSDDMIRAAGQRKRVARRRVQAAEHRAVAAQDRQAQARDREQAARERRQARSDREALADQLAIAEADQLPAADVLATSLADPDHEPERRSRTSGALVVARIEVVGPRSTSGAIVHDTDSELLKRVVQQIQAHVRSYDLLIRINRDEFLCTMFDMTLPVARKRFGAITAGLGAAPNSDAIRIGFAEIHSLSDNHSHGKERTKDPAR